MIREFKHYLHETQGASEFEDELMRQLGITEEEASMLVQKMGRPFYEVTLRCAVDTETGKVSILEVTL